MPRCVLLVLCLLSSCSFKMIPMAGYSHQFDGENLARNGGTLMVGVAFVEAETPQPLRPVAQQPTPAPVVVLPTVIHDDHTPTASGGLVGPLTGSDEVPKGGTLIKGDGYEFRVSEEAWVWLIPLLMFLFGGGVLYRRKKRAVRVDTED